jgi:hypothetical protein
MFFMEDAPEGAAEAGPDAVLPVPPSQDELRDIILELATDLTGDVVPVAPRG